MVGNSITPVVKNLLILNILIYIISIFLFYQTGIDLNNILGLHYIRSRFFEPYQLLTHMFCHAYLSQDGIYFMHIFGNMFGLFMFGPALERLWGAKRFLFYYLMCGLGAAILQSATLYFEIKPVENAKNMFLANPTADNLALFIKKIGGNYQQINNYEKELKDPQVLSSVKESVKRRYEQAANAPTVGASGAIFGILAGFGILFPNTLLMLLFFPFPIKAKYFVLFYAVMELYLGIQINPADSVAHFAHIGGMIIGALIVVYWKRKRDTFY